MFKSKAELCGWDEDYVKSQEKIIFRGVEGRNLLIFWGGIMFAVV